MRNGEFPDCGAARPPSRLQGWAFPRPLRKNGQALVVVAAGDELDADPARPFRPRWVGELRPAYAGWSRVSHRDSDRQLNRGQGRLLCRPERQQDIATLEHGGQPGAAVFCPGPNGVPSSRIWHRPAELDTARKLG